MQTAPVLFFSSGDLIADRRFEWARDCAEKGDWQGAADLLAQTVGLTPGFASAWFALGEARLKLGERDGAIAAFERARAADPQDRHGAALHLMRLGAPLAEMPAGYVRALFDGYAPNFDHALTEGLHYHAPALLRAAVEKARARARFGSMLDLGCGTGLGGAGFRPMVDRLSGVDISAEMLRQARAKGLYDRLAESDLPPFLAAEERAGAQYDLVLAADVFVYFADLAPILRAVAAVLAADGLLAFTVETHGADNVILRETLRYAHGPTHVRTALASAGLRLIALESVSTRHEKGEPVPGLLAVAGR